MKIRASDIVGLTTGGATTFSSSAPSSPSVGDRWVDTTSGNEYVWYTDTDTSQWVQMAAQGSTAGIAANLAQTSASAGSCRIYRSASFTFGTGGFQKIPFDTVYHDPNGWAYLAQNAIRPTVPGYYIVQMRLRSDTAAAEGMAITKNGSGFFGVGIDPTSRIKGQGGSAIVYANGSTDYFGCQMWSTTAQAINNNNYDTYFEMLGPISMLGSATNLQGTSFPTNPVVDQRFYRTDRSIEYFYDGTRWLSSQLHSVEFGMVANISSSVVQYFSVPWLGVYGLWLERFEANTIRTATGQWDIDLVTANAANTFSTMLTLSGLGDATNVWVSKSTNIKAVLDPTIYSIQANHREISGTATFYGQSRLWYRLVG